MIVDVYNQQSNKSGTVELPDKIFNVKWNPRLVHQMLTAQIANARKPLAHTKTRGEVRGGGRKPWRQKHTGRARHGSTRSPLWAGGGVTFGPRKEKSFKQKINKKMRTLALFSVLSKKLKDDEIRIIDGFELNDSKTKNLAKILKAFLGKEITGVLLVRPSGNQKLLLAGRNIAKTDVVSPEGIQVYSCLAHKYVFFDKESLEQFVSRYNVSK